MKAKAKAKIQKPLTSKQLKLSAAERNPGQIPSTAYVEVARETFTESNKVLRQCRNALFHIKARGYLQRLCAAKGDFAKRRELRVIADALQASGFYSSKVATSIVEHMILTRLYRYNISLENCRMVKIGLLNDPDSSAGWRRFCDTVAGESYWNCVPYAVVKAAHTAAKAEAKTR